MLGLKMKERHGICTKNYFFSQFVFFKPFYHLFLLLKIAILTRMGELGITRIYFLNRCVGL